MPANHARKGAQALREEIERNIEYPSFTGYAFAHGQVPACLEAPVPEIPLGQAKSLNLVVDAGLPQEHYFEPSNKNTFKHLAVLSTCEYFSFATATSVE